MSIRVENLTHTYNKGLAYETRAVDDVSFTVENGELIGVIGHTGSGKSTLIQHLNGILKPEFGKIFIGDTEITAKNVKMNEIRKRVGLVFQYPEYQLFDETVRRDVAFGPKNLGLDEQEIDDRVRESMRLVGMDFETFAERSPFELSGGQKRRIAIAGVIAMRPEVLILDEPTAGLDPKAHKDILDMVRTIKDRTAGIVILVSHNMQDIAEMADRIFVMDRGKLVRTGTPAEIFADEDFLQSIGLDVPPTARMARTLAHGGFAPGEAILTLGELTDFIAAGLEDAKQGIDGLRRAGDSGGSERENNTGDSGGSECENGAGGSDGSERENGAEGLSPHREGEA